jgi:hypothetical protein
LVVSTIATVEIALARWRAGELGCTERASKPTLESAERGW